MGVNGATVPRLGKGSGTILWWALPSLSEGLQGPRFLGEKMGEPTHTKSEIKHEEEVEDLLWPGAYRQKTLISILLGFLITKFSPLDFSFLHFQSLD